MARGPIGHTCPAIDKEKKRIKDTISQLSNVYDRFDDYSINDLKEFITDWITSLDSCNDFLEEIRSDNDTLREWGVKMEDQVAARDEEIEKLTSELAELQ